jgi:endonuclease/exonuclease/phosphatase family metal-dependent hydrolase
MIQNYKVFHNYFLTANFINVISEFYDMSKNIKLVSFNIEFCASVTRGYWQYLEFIWKYFLPHSRNAIYEIVDVINDSGIDIATFTEMEGRSYRTRHLNYVGVIAEMTNLKATAFFPVNKLFRFGNRGNGIATAHTLLSSENVKLKTKMENRYLSKSVVKIHNATITVLTTQLALGKRSRSRELKEIAEIINSIDGPIIFTGDLNTQKEDELNILKSTRLKRIETTNTYPSWKPWRRLDYIFYSPDFEIIESYVADKIKVSDHLPVVAEFKLIEKKLETIPKKTLKNISKKSIKKK